MYLRVQGSEFTLNNQPLRLRGVGLGNWLNLEHFMLGIPGTDSEIRAALEATYGSARAARFWQAFYQTYTAESDLRFVQELGLNSLRVPVHFRLFDAPDDDLAASVAIQQLDRVIELAGRLGLLVIIDLHSLPGGQNPDWHCDNASGDAEFWKNETQRASMVQLWGKIADYYADNTVVAGYDLVNEPCYFDATLDKALVDFSAACISAIRRVDPHHVIFIEGKNYARDFSMFARELDPQIAYSFHYYPFLQIPDRLDSDDLPARLRESLYADVSLKHLQDDLKRPIWCGETGHPQHLAKSSRALSIYLQLLEKLGISWAVWPLKDARAMGLLSPRADSAWVELTRRATDCWSFWDLFGQDSLLSAKQESDPRTYYRRLAETTSLANARFAQRLQGIPFDALVAAVQGFSESHCARHAILVESVRSVASRSAGASHR